MNTNVLAGVQQLITQLKGAESLNEVALGKSLAAAVCGAGGDKRLAVDMVVTTIEADIVSADDESLRRAIRLATIFVRHRIELLCNNEGSFSKDPEVWRIAERVRIACNQLLAARSAHQRLDWLLTLVHQLSRGKASRELDINRRGVRGDRKGPDYDPAQRVGDQ